MIKKNKRENSLLFWFLIFNCFSTLQRIYITQTRMPPDAIVITFNIRDIFPSDSAQLIRNLAFNQFRLKARKEVNRVARYPNNSLLPTLIAGIC